MKIINEGGELQKIINWMTFCSESESIHRAIGPIYCIVYTRLWLDSSLLARHAVTCQLHMLWWTRTQAFCRNLNMDKKFPKYEIKKKKRMESTTIQIIRRVHPDKHTPLHFSDREITGTSVGAKSHLITARAPWTPTDRVKRLHHRELHSLRLWRCITKWCSKTPTLSKTSWGNVIYGKSLIIQSIVIKLKCICCRRSSLVSTDLIPIL